MKIKRKKLTLEVDFNQQVRQFHKILTWSKFKTYLFLMKLCTHEGNYYLNISFAYDILHIVLILCTY